MKIASSLENKIFKDEGNQMLFIALGSFLMILPFFHYVLLALQKCLVFVSFAV